MGRIIVASGLGGWLAIVAIAWRMADNRIAVACGPFAGLEDPQCLASMQAKRDAILTGGLAVALAFIIISMIVFAVIKARRGDRPIAPSFGWRPANRGQQTRLR
jgi:hypothetical protein